MVFYDIHAAGVQGVLTRTAGHAEVFGSAVPAIESSLSGAGGQSDSAQVAGALGDFLDAVAPSVKFCGQRVEDAISGTVKAVGAYHAGDAAMAANAQSSAADAPVPHDLPGEGT